jgi:DNA mismatch repair protein MutS
MKSKEVSDACLLFRVGDFFTRHLETMLSGTSKILGITLTKRGAGSATETALGFPHHSINTLPKLVKQGFVSPFVINSKILK